MEWDWGIIVIILPPYTYLFLTFFLCTFLRLIFSLCIFLLLQCFLCIFLLLVVVVLLWVLLLVLLPVLVLLLRSKINVRGSIARVEAIRSHFVTSDPD